jgi:prepilin-type N-terminal cleavage/methylation domain-containing protein
MSPQNNRRTAASARQGFSLIELVIVVVIIGIIAAIAIPKMSKGSAGASDSALQGNLAVLRNAIELYNSEHGALPTSDVVAQLTSYTDNAGTTSATKVVATGHTFGPYLRKIPPLPVGSKKGLATMKAAASSVAAGTGDEAWLYYTDTGEVKANLPDAQTPKDSTTAYNAF